MTCILSSFFIFMLPISWTHRSHLTGTMTYLQCVGLSTLTRSNTQQLFTILLHLGQLPSFWKVDNNEE